MALAIWFQETRPHFLVLSLILALLGGAVAATFGAFTWSATLLAGLGVLLLHASVNTLNDYEDFKSGLDLRTQRTQFSGGSGILPAGLMTPAQVRALGLGAFLLTVPIGAYFFYQRGLGILPLLAFGAVAVLFYTTHLQRVGFGLAEITAGLGLGTLPVLGIAYVNNGLYDPRSIFAAVPSGLLVLNLLLMNEFPDRDADATVGRRTLPIHIGWRGAAIVYTLACVLTYAWIVTGVALGIWKAWALLALLTIPAAVVACSGLFGTQDPARILRSQSANVMMVLLTQALLAIGLIVAHWR
ncbi:MAG: prenyltransferase [Vicinamibacteria bacterium]|jgi:1,4-dihydroxy-2-naphthoate octaprenyltransferase|nr:prenyltransferase [Vicinamibacteria bacterium]